MHSREKEESAGRGAFPSPEELCQGGGSVAIFGAGASGQAAGELLAAHSVPYAIYDQKDRNPGFERAGKGLHRWGVVSPGFRPDHPWLALARERGIRLISELDLGQIYFPGRSIAVTGTNGKTTLTQLMAEALVRGGVFAKSCGNNGYPFCKYVLESLDQGREVWAVVEVSSFQAFHSRLFSPEALVWPHFSSDHLDWHGSLKNYYRAKQSLLSRVRNPEWIFLGNEVVKTGRRLGGEGSGLPRPVDPRGRGAVGSLRTTPFGRGPFRRNYLFAELCFEGLGFSNDWLREAAGSMIMPPHRLEKFASQGGVDFIDDSKATNFSAALAAVKAFRRPIHWIGGGKAKGSEAEALARALAPRLSSAATIGETGPKLAKILSDGGVPAEYAGTLPEAVLSLWKRARRGSIVLLSPGFASFDQFESYIARGRTFQSEVLRLIQTSRSD